MNEPLPPLAPLLRGSLIGAIALFLFGGVACQPKPTVFSLIPGGSFTMGSEGIHTWYDLKARSATVTVSPFYIQQTETTKAQWDEVRTWGLSNGYTDLEAGSGKASNHPVHEVSWWDVVKWCNARSEKEGLTPVYTVSGAVMRTGTTEPRPNWSANGYRLPTEAEWEKAARGGVEGKLFPWGTDTVTQGQGNFRYNREQQTYTSPVGSFAANGYGLYDMAGNVFEWCWDWYDDVSPGERRPEDPRGPSWGEYRVYRGGGWSADAFFARCAIRVMITPGFTDDYLGFRPVRSSVP